MVKLNNNEVQDVIELETSYVDKTSNYKNIPSDAYSKFYFEIKENIEDLVYEMTKKSKKHYPQERFIREDGSVNFDKPDSLTFYELKNYKKNDKGATYELHDPTFYSYAKVYEENDKLTIHTALSSFKYVITQNEKGDGCVVEFSGPLNGLLRQALLPNMTYVPYTLQGKFIMLEEVELNHKTTLITGKEHGITDYMPIEQYCALRELKNKGNKNPQDGYGWQINALFNNEIPCFAECRNLVYVNEQERKNENAQYGFENNHKLDEWDIKFKKAEIRKRIEEYKQMTLEIRKRVDKSTPIKEVNANMVFNTYKDR